MRCLSRKIALVKRWLIGLAMVLLAAVPVAAADPFEIGGVEVDVTAPSAALARDQAIAEGERRAFETLLDRLVAADVRASVKAPERPALQAMIQDFSIASEKASTVRYIATMVVRFDAEAVQGWLIEQGVPFAATPSDPVVVVPVWEAGGTVTLWDDPNPWRDAWDAGADAAVMVPTILPEGGLADVATLTARQALDGDAAALIALAERYETTESLVAYARLIADTRSGTTIVAVTAGRFGPEGRRWLADVNVRPEPGEDRDAALRRAVAAVVQEVDQRWKQDATVSAGHAEELEVVVPIASLRDWVDVRRQLEAMVVVRDLDVLMLASDVVRVRLLFVGDMEQLTKALAAAGLTLTQGAPDWVLAPPARDGAGR
jgi:hypothetical protein